MKIHADLDEFAAVHVEELEWIPSPVKGVDRKMLDRDGQEVARATTVVRYGAGMSFPEHTHGGGEEFLVLEGDFADKTGVYTPGSYVRNPIGSTHAPWSTKGAQILVKLRQMFDESENKQTIVHTQEEKAGWQQVSKGRRRVELFSSDVTGEHVWMEEWETDVVVEWQVHAGGEELFVLSGSFTEVAKDDQKQQSVAKLSRGSWQRRPAAHKGQTLVRTATATCRVFFKSGHLVMKPKPKA